MLFSEVADNLAFIIIIIIVNYCKILFIYVYYVYNFIVVKNYCFTS